MGRPCSGKTTIAKAIPTHPETIFLDGDVLRRGINSDLGFSVDDRTENIRRAAHLAEMLNKSGHNVIASFVTPTKDIQKLVTSIISNCQFIYIDCSLEKCIERDVKGMYAKAITGEIPEFTGISSPFEPPQECIRINTENQTLDSSIQELSGKLIEIKYKEISNKDSKN